MMGWHGKITDAALEDFYSNHCIDGKCIHCGECCADLLPLTPGELEIIRRYVKKHKIREHRQAPVLGPKCYGSDVSLPEPADKAVRYLSGKALHMQGIHLQQGNHGGPQRP